VGDPISTQYIGVPRIQPCRQKNISAGLARYAITAVPVPFGAEDAAPPCVKQITAMRKTRHLHLGGEPVGKGWVGVGIIETALEQSADQIPRVLTTRTHPLEGTHDPYPQTIDPAQLARACREQRNCAWGEEEDGRNPRKQL